jgi:tetratricopeptide (TPR) repeat protein
MRRYIKPALVLVLALCSILAFGVTTQSKSWLLYEQGNAAIARKEFGEALRLYKDAVAAAGVFPEAELAIGDVYLEEGEFDLAKSQYEKAYNQRKAFFIDDSKYDVLYKLAHLYEGQELYKLMEDRLLAIVADDKHFAETAQLRLRTQVEKNYFERGIDHVLVLYSFKDAFAADAHSKLGWFYYRTGRYSQSISHLLYSVLNRSAQINNFLQERDVDSHVSGLHDLISEVEKSRELSEYAHSIELYKDLYYLASATFAAGYRQNSLGLWKLLSSSPSAGQFQSLSLKQLKSPWIEPLIGVTAKPR